MGVEPESHDRQVDTEFNLFCRGLSIAVLYIAGLSLALWGWYGVATFLVAGGLGGSCVTLIWVIRLKREKAR